MKSLKSLTFTAQPEVQKSPAMVRRNKLLTHLEQQKLLAENPSHVRKLRKWVTQEGGVKTAVEVEKRVSPWWRVEETGTIYLTVRYGAKPVEFEKGKAAIVIKDKAKLVPTLEMIIAAVRSGELDEQLKSHLQSLGTPKTRRTT